ncbi:sulfite exporter TauE/SafE family protein [Pseudemcibacter aquimaris]|uniref:sulfite exporter TauE/SafE family protein n=1 Tax=Pseudemcibacter aquimaris TaxID=2857064 RepID=UPI0020127B0A|nr:sulfite exporter TauE/SafE family protein [Pseudemcibacter aquimaris]MCC3862136.1 sulfite exporter TauE/SafE family protein [Pseudemcibacter aquimaris]WDU58889.1 sulfite exporter TauE/SafE family protein [Pseudemcibacter aquimaris]
MNEFADLSVLVLMLLGGGIISGLMAGLLGIGGGIVLVPVIEIALEIYGVNESVRMHIAIATSLAVIILSSFSSTRAHYKRGAVDIGIITKWAPAMLFGAVLGSWAASRLDGTILVILFAALALFVALKMLFKGGTKMIRDGIPDHPLVQIMPYSIGMLSSMVGIGGGVMGVSYMSLFGVPIHRAVGTAAFFGVLIAVPGTISFMISGQGIDGMPSGNIGYVSFIGLAIIAPASYFAAPFGARLAHSLSHQKLTFAFGLFLLFVSSQMLYRYL